MTSSEVATIKRRAIRVSRLPKEAQLIVAGYKGLQLGTKKVSTPYYINRADPIPCLPGEHYKTRQSLNRAYLSKGNPKEIESLVKQLALKHSFDLNRASVQEIQEFMFKQGIGIDCSGFVVWTLNELSLSKLNKPFWKYIQTPGSILRKLIYNLRPIENISAMTLKNNAVPIKDLKDARAGDVIVTHPKLTYTHIILINEVGFSKDGKPLYLDYCQATEWYSYLNGIIDGTIVVTNPDKYLTDQVWFEDGVKKNYTFAGVLNNIPAAKIMRFDFLTS